ncbi:LysR family transcriptional regulator [Clostridium sp. YIM B02515]|uniref:LysR family transcriptional regulator n=1 Tax=Clostridium rhizosphaerae TaxID=2803861 RepID=A0ABS1T4K2_9CLOT|nr:LysR family transcriptional regulator [Clostridium rhizosphaerae]MBL4934259.1 LysR family transcriptional regulator [Clostridium rhizosphaerae]
MESNDLRIFQVVAYEGSISKAALKMGYVQSNVTLRIKTLEDELGTKLLIRHSKGVSLTPGGEKLLVYADQVIRILDEAVKALKNNDNNNYLKIGATQTIAASIVPKWLSIYSERYSDVSLSLKTDNQRGLIEQLINGELDGAFINSQFTHQNIKSVFTFNEELAIVSSTDIKEVDEVLKKPIIIKNDINCPYRVLLEKWVIANNGNLSRVMEIDSLEAILKCVSDGMGISLLPKSVIKDSNKVYTHELSNEYNKLPINFIIRKDLNVNTLINNFIDVLFES